MPSANLNGRAPILFLPVRIETRFLGSADKPQLLVRIYPDQIHISSFNPQLTDDEVAAGLAYWTAVRLLNESTPSDGTKARWKKLVAAFGSPRAAYVRQQTSGGAPSGPTRSDSWTTPSVAVALPDYWVVECYDGSRKVVSAKGKPIPATLNVGPDPGWTNTNTDLAQLPLDPGMLWMVDYQTAVCNGMAVTVGLTAPYNSKGFTRVLVYGVRTSEPGEKTLINLMRDHLYTDGFSIVTQGTPTKNTTDATSGYTETDGGDTSFPIVHDSQLVDPPNGECDGRMLAQGLGVAAPSFEHVANAGAQDQADAIAMATALWPGTIGYFARDLLFRSSQSSLVQKMVDGLKMRFIQYVRGRGATPAIRVGDIPYGVVAVTSLAKYGYDLSTSDRGLLQSLINLKNLWLTASEQSPQIAPGQDPDVALAQIMGMQASSASFSMRWFYGPLFFYNLLSLVQSQPAAAAWYAAASASTSGFLQSLGLAGFLPLTATMAGDQNTYPVTLPMIGPSSLSETNTLDFNSGFNYITWLNNASVDDIHNENFPAGVTAPTALLYTLLRHSILLAYTDLAADLQRRAGNFSGADGSDVEFVNFGSSNAKSRWEALSMPIPNLTGSGTVGGFLTGVATNYRNGVTVATAYAPITDMMDALKQLSERPTAELARLLGETLDVCSHRVDAWLSSYANEILAGIRSSKSASQSVHIGGYGWVENLSPQQAQPALENSDEKAAVSNLDSHLHKLGVTVDTVRQPPLDNGGFIHAPSTAQAGTAAILRSGYMSHAGTADGQLLALDLSSDRVRKALWVLDGVRQGLSLGAMLGYRFEANLLDSAAPLGQYIDPFRKRYPLVVGKLTPAGNAPQLEGAPNVVDGNALLEAYQAGSISWGPDLPSLPAFDAPLKNLEDTIDALGELGMAESVFQIVRGNPENAGAILNAISRGDNPPQVQFVDSPRSGVDLTHRALVLFEGVASEPAVNARATAEPWLNDFAAAMLPAPKNVACVLNYQSINGNPAPPPPALTVTLDQLSLDAIDFLSMGDSPDTPAQSELELRLLDLAARTGPAWSAPPVISYAPRGSSLTIPQFLVAIRALRDAIGASRPLSAADLDLPSATGQPISQTSADALELFARVTQALNTQATAQKNLQQSTNSLRTTILGLASGSGATAPAPTISAVQTALRAASVFGIPGSIPPWPSAQDGTLETTLVTQGDRLAAALRQNQAAVSASSTAATFLAQVVSGVTQWQIGFTNAGPQPGPPRPTDPTTPLWTKLPPNLVDRPRLAANSGTITILAPPGTMWTTSASNITINGVPCVTVNVANTILTATTPIDLDPLEAVLVVVSDVTNPPNGSYALALRTQADKIAVNLDATFGTGNGVTGVTVQVDNPCAAASGGYMVNAQIGKALSAGTGTVTIIASPETVFSQAAGDCTVNGVPLAASPVVAAGSIQLTTPMLLNAGDTIAIELQNVTHAGAGTYRLSIMTSAEPFAASSATFQIAPSIADLTTSLQAMFGRSFVVLPQFVPTNGPALQTAFGRPGQFGDDTTFAAWIQQLTHTRPAIAKFDFAMSCAKVCQGMTPTMAVAQLPYYASDAWIATSLPTSQPPPVSSARLSLAIFQSETYDPTLPHAGLLIDEWPERIPNPGETTGLAFHYSEPQARAPKALLLAVAPRSIAQWELTDGLISSILGDTLDLAKVRTVDTSTPALTGGGLLPLLYFAFNPSDATVSVDFQSFDSDWLALLLLNLGL